MGIVELEEGDEMASQSGTQSGSTTVRRRVLPLIAPELVATVVTVSAYLLAARGVIEADGGDFRFQLVLSPSPAVALLIVAIFVIAALARRATQVGKSAYALAYLLGLIVPVLAIAGTALWVAGFAADGAPYDRLGGPWWSVAELRFM